MGRFRALKKHFCFGLGTVTDKPVVSLVMKLSERRAADNHQPHGALDIGNIFRPLPLRDQELAHSFRIFVAQNAIKLATKIW